MEARQIRSGVIWGIVIGFLLSIAAHALSAEVDVSWDANSPEDEVKYYNVYYGNYSGNTKTFLFTNRTSTTKTYKSIKNLPTDKKLYFRVTAVNSTTQSMYSNKVKVNFPSAPSGLNPTKIVLP
jgi:hypothetical protein